MTISIGKGESEDLLGGSKGDPVGRPYVRARERLIPALIQLIVATVIILLSGVAQFAARASYDDKIFIGIKENFGWNSSDGPLRLESSDIYELKVFGAGEGAHYGFEYPQHAPETQEEGQAESTRALRKHCPG